MTLSRMTLFRETQSRGPLSQIWHFGQYPEFVFFKLISYIVW